MNKNDLRDEWRKQHNPNEGHFDAVTIYMGSSYNPDNPVHVHTAEQARIIGEGLADRGIRLAYGGGSRGIMGILSQAVLDAGGTITGYTLPEFAQTDHDDAAYDQLKYEVVKPDINTRKDALYNDGDALIAMPGGIGTEEEIWDALGKSYLSTYSGSEDNSIKQVILVNINGHYDSFMTRLDDMIASGYASAESRKMVKVVTSGEEVLQTLDKLYENGPEQIHGTIGNISKTQQKPKP